MTTGRASQPLIVFGITGRMGQSLIAALREGSPFHLQGAIASAEEPTAWGRTLRLEGATGIKITDENSAALPRGAVAVDFSTGQAVAAHAHACAQARVPLLVGATGIDAPSQAAASSVRRKPLRCSLPPTPALGLRYCSSLVAAATVELWDQPTMWKSPRRTII